MSTNNTSTSRSAASAANPSGLPPRYEVRQLTLDHLLFVQAILAHCHTYSSNVIGVIHADDLGKFFNRFAAAGKYLCQHQIESGMSFGVFDMEYQYKRPESAATGGKFYWDPNNDDVTGDQILEQMDFPLVSIALSYDGANPFDERLGELVAVIPELGHLYSGLDARDPRSPESWKAKGPNEVLMRASTCTKSDYMDQKLMGPLARWLMREAKSRGYKLINIEAWADAVTHVWSNPPAPFKGTIVAEFNSWEYDGKDEEGKNPFRNARTRCTRVIVEL